MEDVVVEVGLPPNSSVTLNTCIHGSMFWTFLIKQYFISTTPF